VDEVGYLGHPDTIATLEAIYEYVQNQRKLIPQFPAIKELIESFEGWYQQAGAFTVVTQSDVDEAKRRRYAINKATGNLIPDDVIPADNPQIPPKEPDPWYEDIYKNLGGPGLGVVAPTLVVILLGGALYMVLSRSRFSFKN
jgi:hypothetical protein